MKKLIVGNWKMNPVTLKEAKTIFNSIKRGIKVVKKAKNIDVVICPPSIYLPSFSVFAPNRRSGKIFLGSQNCYWEEKGAFTGEISPLMLNSLGVDYVIIGHSERRALGETDEMINKKIQAALKAGLKPILCVGETSNERRARKTLATLRRQLKEGLKSIFSLKSNIANLTVAYEPVWAIGTGKACGVSEGKEANLFIRKTVGKFPRIIYGGSVNSQNTRAFIREAKFQGLLPGAASLNPKEFVGIIKNAG